MSGPSGWQGIPHHVCPKCGEDKFVGHGPLCLDCYLDATPNGPESAE